MYNCSFGDVKLKMANLLNLLDTKYDEWLLREQLTEHFRSQTPAILGNSVNYLILCGLFWSVAPFWLLAFFGILLTITLIWRGKLGSHFAKETDSLHLPAFTSSVNYMALLLGGFWGITIVSLFPYADNERVLVLGLVSAGMMTGGMSTFRTRFNASRIYLASICPGPFFGFIMLSSSSGYAALSLLFSFSLFLLKQASNVSKQFDASVRHSRDLFNSNETVSLLLNEFEEQGSDWLFEIDGFGNIINPSDRFAQMCQRPIETLERKPLGELLQPECANELNNQLSSRLPFKHKIVSLLIGGDKKWWSINARPTQEGHWRGIMTDITAQRQAEEQVSHLARFDGLTNLPNRFDFNQRLYHFLNTGSGKVALMYIDLDNFKTINDTLGHPIGDRLLSEVAKRLQNCVSTEDVVARLGGDEFAVIVGEKRLEHVDKIAEDIVTRMAQVFSLGENDVVIGASVGIASAPQDTTDADVLIRKADLALYAAKTAGRNRAMHFSADMDEAAQHRRMLEMDLRSAIAKGEFKLHYQSLVDITSEETTGYEALIRWEHPERGTVMPNDFIHIAEETGMILQIGEWVIRQAVSDLRNWADPISVSINLSPIQMRSPSLITTMAQAIAINQVDPSRICLEITENVLMQDSEANIETLHALRRLGLKIALDDFGTGYSSLNYLRSFPFSKIKIDRCFITDIDVREDCQAIVRSVVDLAKSLGMTTTAEGVERKAQFEALQLQGCSEVQGFLFSKAIAIEGLSNLRQPSGNIVKMNEIILSTQSQMIERKAG
jgi:diguanylate cyclase (GGDEF)-like protein